MWIFICLLCALGVVLTLIKISLLERKQLTLVLTCLTAILSIISIPWATRINMQGLSRFLNHQDVLNNLCTLHVIESIAMLLVVAHLMKQHVDHKPVSLARMVVLLPSSACLTGVFVLMVFLFNTITGHSYFLIGCFYGLGVFTVLAGGALIVRRLMTAWYARLETVLILSFVQLILAMFLPLVARGLTVPAHEANYHIRALPVSVLLTLLFAAGTFAVRKITKNIWGDRTK